MSMLTPSALFSASVANRRSRNAFAASGSRRNSPSRFSNHSPFASMLATRGRTFTPAARNWSAILRSTLTDNAPLASAKLIQSGKTICRFLRCARSEATLICSSCRTNAALRNPGPPSDAAGAGAVDVVAGALGAVAALGVVDGPDESAATLVVSSSLTTTASPAKRAVWRADGRAGSCGGVRTLSATRPRAAKAMTASAKPATRTKRPRRAVGSSKIISLRP